MIDTYAKYVARRTVTRIMARAQLEAKNTLRDEAHLPLLDVEAQLDKDVPIKTERQWKNAKAFQVFKLANARPTVKPPEGVLPGQIARGQQGRASWVWRLWKMTLGKGVSDEDIVVDTDM